MFREASKMLSRKARAQVELHWQGSCGPKKAERRVPLLHPTACDGRVSDATRRPKFILMVRYSNTPPRHDSDPGPGDEPLETLSSLRCRHQSADSGNYPRVGRSSPSAGLETTAPNSIFDPQSRIIATDSLEPRIYYQPHAIVPRAHCQHLHRSAASLPCGVEDALHLRETREALRLPPRRACV